MLSPEFGRAGLMIGMFVALPSGALLLVLQPGSAEFIVSALTFGVGMLFLIGIVVLIRIGTRRQD